MQNRYDGEDRAGQTRVSLCAHRGPRSLVILFATSAGESDWQGQAHNRTRHRPPGALGDDLEAIAGTSLDKDAELDALASVHCEDSVILTRGFLV